MVSRARDQGVTSMMVQIQIKDFVRQTMLRLAFGPMKARLIKGRPWMRQREIWAIQNVLDHLRPERCLEWGTGFGTLHFANRLGPSATWLSVEHDQGWAASIRAQNTGNRAEILWAPPATPAERRNEDDAEDNLVYAARLQDYVMAPRDRGPFDFILVDGRARRNCFLQALGWLAPGGVLALHDANRPYLWDLQHHLAHSIHLTDYRDGEGGLLFGSQDRPVADWLDQEAAIRLWDWAKCHGALLRH